MKSDSWITDRVLTDSIIQPFSGVSVKSENGRKVCSYGISCAGYDLRLGKDVYSVCGKETLDPKETSIEKDFIRSKSMIDEKGEYVLLRPGFSLASTVEYIDMPDDATALLLIKSTYARLGVSIIAPLIEPGWRGYPTVSIVNNNKIPVKLYLNEGFCQIVFFGCDGVKKNYDQHGGRYQDSVGATVSSVQ